MLNKTVCIVCPLDSPFNIDDLYNKGLGGAETWVIQMSLQFAANGYHVIIFNVNNYNLCYEYGAGIDILPLYLMDVVCSYQYFEHLFINRYIEKNVIEKLQKYNNCNNLYFILHDINLWKQQPFVINIKSQVFTQEDIDNNDWVKSHLRKIFFMSKWHIDNSQQFCNYDNSLLEIIGNGINIPDEIDYTLDRDNNMLWSSCIERGLDIFIDKILPRIKEKIPDFKLYVSTYSSDTEIKPEYQDNLIFLGSLSKEKLYEEMKKHKVSFLPLVHWETFCITSIENIANGVIFLAPFKFGLRTIFKYFEPIMLKDGNFNDEEYCDYIANEIIDKINNYEQYINLQKILYSYIKDNYSWESIYNKLSNIIKPYETNNSYYM